MRWEGDGREVGGGREVEGKGGYRGTEWEMKYMSIDDVLFRVSIHRGVGAMEIVAMDMKVSFHGYKGQVLLPNTTSHSCTEVPLSV